MRRMIKVWLAKWLKGQRLNLEGINDLDAARWNHLSAVISSKGAVKFDWNKIRKIAVVKCSRCCKVQGKAEDFPQRLRERGAMMCGDCVIIQIGKEKEVKKRTGTRKRKTTSRRPKRVRKNS